MKKENDTPSCHDDPTASNVGTDDGRVVNSVGWIEGQAVVSCRLRRRYTGGNIVLPTGDIRSAPNSSWSPLPYHNTKASNRGLKALQSRVSYRDFVAALRQFFWSMRPEVNEYRYSGSLSATKGPELDSQPDDRRRG